MMTKDEYIEAVNVCCTSAAGAGPQWNQLFVSALAREGLMLKPINEDRGVDHYVQAPWPFPEGEPQWGESWIVEQ